ncbi:MAG TPA: hypothetical protein G4O08_01595 [Anaerolineae bacterium]|nr:hypothetical protein [Anaerolineae bacterium]
MIRKFVVLFVLLLLALLLGACGGGSPSPTCDPSELTPPVLTFPHDGGQFIPGQTTMTWYHQVYTCEVEGYRAEIDTTSDFSSGNVFGATTTWPNSVGWPVPIQEGVTYYWRVLATVGSLEGPWSVVQSFQGVPPCELSELVAPVPVGPWEGRTLFFDDPYYSWDYLSTACAPEGYHLQVSDDPSFATSSVDDTIGDPVMGWKPSSALADCTVHYWRIAGTAGGVDGPFSDPVSFYVTVDDLCPTLVCPPTGLIAPEPTGPGGYEIVGSLTPTLQWNYPTYCEPEGFVIHLEPEYDLSSAPLQGGFGLTDSWTPGAALEPATQYWWDVAAISVPALGPFGEKNTFFTGPECTPSDTLGPPELVSPADGSQIHETYAWLHFNAGSSVGCIPDGYVADLQTDPNFGGTNLLQTFMFPATNIITDPLQDCTEHFWRIAAIQDGVTGPWSETWSFLTNAAGNCAVSMLPDLPAARALLDLACYRGPDPGLYGIVGYLQEGESAHILAQNSPGTWWVIQAPEGTGVNHCYVPKANVETIGDVSGVPGQSDPLICSADLNQPDCIAAGGTWVPNFSRPSASYCDCD